MVPRNFEPDRGDGSSGGSGRSGRSGGSGRSGRSGGSGRSGHVQGPGRCVVPDLTPVRAGRRGRHRLRRIVYGRRRITAAGLAVAAAALAASAPRGDRGSDTGAGPAPDSASSPAASSPGTRGHGRTSSGPAASAASVSAPVRIADAGTVRLLRPGDRVDVIAGTDGSAPARLVAKGARVDRVPKYVETGPVDGALVVLRVPRRTATALAGAAVTTRLAVTLC